MRASDAALHWNSVRGGATGTSSFPQGTETPAAAGRRPKRAEPPPSLMTDPSCGVAAVVEHEQYQCLKNLPAGSSRGLLSVLSFRSKSLAPAAANEVVRLRHNSGGEARRNFRPGSSSSGLLYPKPDSKQSCADGCSGSGCVMAMCALSLLDRQLRDDDAVLGGGKFRSAGRQFGGSSSSTPRPARVLYRKSNSAT